MSLIFNIKSLHAHVYYQHCHSSYQLGATKTTAIKSLQDSLLQCSFNCNLSIGLLLPGRQKSSDSLDQCYPTLLTPCDCGSPQKLFLKLLAQVNSKAKTKIH